MRSVAVRLAVFVSLTLVAGAAAASCAGDDAVGSEAQLSGSPELVPAALAVEIVDRIPHDAEAFTQGFFFDEQGRLFEGTGLEGQSAIRELDPTSGEVLREEFLPEDVFGEGAALGPTGIVQLTWTSGIAYSWNADTFEPGEAYDYSGEGWGLTFDGENFWQSDGSGTLTRRDGNTFASLGTVDVTRGGAPTDELNELEWIDGTLYSNVWHSDDILMINPDSGVVTGVIDASELYDDESRTREMTLNGIAHLPGDPTDRLWLTGKNWPEMFVVDVVKP